MIFPPVLKQIHTSKTKKSPLGISVQQTSDEDDDEDKESNFAQRLSDLKFASTYQNKSIARKKSIQRKQDAVKNRTISALLALKEARQQRNLGEQQEDPIQSTSSISVVQQLESTCQSRKRDFGGRCISQKSSEGKF